MLTGLTGGAVLYALDLALGASTTGCGGHTTGSLVDLTFTARADVSAGDPFVNAEGWSVLLTRIQVALAGLHLFESADPKTAASWPWPSISIAHAHPGHVTDAGVRAELTQPALLDLADGPQSLGHGRGVAGDVGSGHVVFDDTMMDGWAIWLEGEASRDDASRDFVARAGIPEMISWDGAPEIWDCPVDTDSITDDARVELVVSPRWWLDDLDFGMLPDSDTPIELDPQSSMDTDFLAAARSPNGWSFHIAAPS